jgi:hypothetical protein
MKRRFLLIPFLFVFASLFQLGYVSSHVVSPDQILRPLIVLWLFVALLAWPAYWLTHDWNWAIILLTIFVLGFTSSSNFFSTVLAFLAIVGVCWLTFIRLKRGKLQLAHFMYILGGTSLFFAAYAIFLESTMLAQIPWTRYRRAIFDARNYSLPSLSTPSVKRDIYFIVVDGYARSDLLQEMFGFDNSEFITYLREKGFIVPASSHSNYPSTPLSIASTLNMDYIQSLAPGLDRLPHRWLMAPLIDHSRVRALLEIQGYQTISISTNWTITDNVTTDRYLHPFPVMLTDFEGFVMDLTPLQSLEPIMSGFASLPTPESHREIIRYNFATLSDLPGIPGPKFVFAHIISPHPPFVFDQAGGPLDSPHSFTFQDANEFPGPLKEYREQYIGQVQFVNHQLQKTIDDILAQSDVPPIIILQADHGSGLLTDLTSAENTCFRERFSPFAAYSLPDVKRDAIPPDISTINLFRIILNEYFYAQLPLLENKQYFYKNTQTYYDFEDVTARLTDICVLPKE